jgi:hypothetical protein
MHSFITNIANHIVIVWPSVKLTTINKALLGGTLDQHEKKYLYLFNHKKEYHKKITFLLTKARTCFQVSMNLLLRC